MASATPDLWLPSQPKLVFIAPTHTGMARLSCPLVSDNRKKCLSPNFTESEKLILKSHPDLDQHHNLTTLGLRLGVILLIDKTTERMTVRTNDRITPPALVE